MMHWSPAEVSRVNRARTYSIMLEYENQHPFILTQQSQSLLAGVPFAKMKRGAADSAAPLSDIETC
jgi:hypothetical protein